MEVETVQSVQMNIYQSNIYRKNLGWLHFDNEARCQVNVLQSYIPVLVVYPNIQVATSSTKSVTKTVFCASSYSRFIEAPSNLKRKKLHKKIKGPIFLCGGYIAKFTPHFI